MTNTINSRILLKTDVTNNWEQVSNSFIPAFGEACIYLDRFQTVNDIGETIYVPGIKIGDGNSYIGELEFIREDFITNEEIEQIFGINIIIFFIKGTEYRCREGMTWDEFIDSEYNDGTIKRPYSGEPNSVIFGDNNAKIEEAYLNEIIIANKNYELSPAEPA